MNLISDHTVKLITYEWIQAYEAQRRLVLFFKLAEYQKVIDWCNKGLAGIYE